MVVFSRLINEATEYAAVAHARQFRKSPEVAIPYVQHPVMVGLILQRAGCDEEVVAAGLLHDVLEDTPTTAAELGDRFGARILRIVQSVSEADKGESWEVRKAGYLEALRSADSDAWSVAAADKIHNIESILLSLDRGVDIWSRFRRGREAQIERFRRIHDFLRGRWEHVLVDELSESLERLEGAT